MNLVTSLYQKKKKNDFSLVVVYDFEHQVIKEIVLPPFSLGKTSVEETEIPCLQPCAFIIQAEVLQQPMYVQSYKACKQYCHPKHNLRRPEPAPDSKDTPKLITPQSCELTNKCLVLILEEFVTL